MVVVIVKKFITDVLVLNNYFFEVGFGKIRVPAEPIYQALQCAFDKQNGGCKTPGSMVALTQDKDLVCKRMIGPASGK